MNERLVDVSGHHVSTCRLIRTAVIGNAGASERRIVQMNPFGDVSKKMRFAVES